MSHKRNNDHGGGVKLSLLTTTALISFSTTAHADRLLYNGSHIENDILYIHGETTENDRGYYKLTDGEQVTLSSIEGQIAPEIIQHQFSINIDNSNLTVTGPVNIEAISTNKASGWDQGTYIFYAVNSGTINLQGNIDILSKHDLKDQAESIGNNIFYASNASSINIGSKDSQTKAWAIANKPDLISAKKGSTVIINSTNNQLVGSFDMLDSKDGQIFKSDTISGTFSGEQSYWFGDEQSWMNVRGVDDTGDQNIQNALNTDTLNLTFEKGAQWTYFGVREVSADKNVKPLIKRISAITLNDGGIINLYDKNIQQIWEDIGLLSAFPGLDQVNHNYVRIGNLKGTEGIFRLDLNVEDKSQSDMIFVESSDDHGKFYIEPYNPEYLTAITPDNTLRFATVSKDSGVTFADSENIYGHTLYDYELIIDREEYREEDEDNNLYEDRVSADYEEDNEIKDKAGLDFSDGDINWFIKRVIVKDSAASLAMTGAGYATYDAITQLDRYDSRNTDVSRYAGEKEGIWVRIKHGQNGSKNQYSGDYTKATVGFDHYITSSNRIGVGFTYLSGDADFDDVNGSGDLTGYEGMIYDTQYFDNQYLDFVFRFGDVKNEFDAVNAVGALPISADYHQKYAALSAEYGFRYTDARGVFFEPQAQFQLAYLDDADYDTQRNMSTDIDSAVSAVGRIGIRVGKSWELDNGYTNDLYIRSDVMHQFTDGQDALYTDGTNRVDVTWGDKNTWYDLGFGGIVHLGDNFSMALDVSKSVGDDVTDTWAINGQARVIF